MTATTEPITEPSGQLPPTRVSLPGDPEDVLIDDACRDLRLPAFRERFVELAATARREQHTYKQFLLELLQVELADRDVRRQQRLVRAAKFPRPKRLQLSGVGDSDGSVVADQDVSDAVGLVRLNRVRESRSG